jgi:hypothetical protein
MPTPSVRPVCTAHRHGPRAYKDGVRPPVGLVSNRRNIWPVAQRRNLTVWAPPSAPKDLPPTVVAIFNGWAAVCGVRFKLWKRGMGPPVVRLDFSPGTGFWTWGEGQELLGIARNEANVGLDVRTAAEAVALREYLLHEAGHILGFGHEHFHPEIQRRLIRDRVYTRFRDKYGWSPEETHAQMFDWRYDTKQPAPDFASIMTYELEGDLFIDGVGIPYARVLSAGDGAMARKRYPLGAK